MTSQQQPYQPQQQQQQALQGAQRPPFNDPNAVAAASTRPPAPAGQPQGMPYRPAGTPPPSMQPPPGPGTRYRPASTPPLQHQAVPRPGMASPMRPPTTPGYPTQSPTMAARPLPPGARPPMRPPIGTAAPVNRPMSPTTGYTQQAAAPQVDARSAYAAPATTGTPPPMSPTSQTNTPLSPTASVSHGVTAGTDHQRRKRMYPEQITKAYMDQPVSPAGAYGGVAPQPQFAAPASYGQPAPPAPQQAPQQQFQQPYNAYNQGAVNNLTAQFGNMQMGGSMGSVSVSLNHNEHHSETRLKNECRHLNLLCYLVLDLKFRNCMNLNHLYDFHLM